MRPFWPALIGIISAIPATAQNAPIHATQLPPLQQQSRQDALPSPQQFPAAGTQTQSQALGIVPGTPPPPANAWLPAGVAKLQALDKVNAQGMTLTIKVGQSATFGSLTIAVKACMVRPTDQSADAAAFVDVIDSHPESPRFNGWMLQAAPAVSMMQHPIYDLRVTGCT